MSAKREVLQRLPFALSLFGGLLLLQLVVMPLVEDWGGLRWVVLGAYVFVWFGITGYVAARVRARERQAERRRARKDGHADSPQL